MASRGLKRKLDIIWTDLETTGLDVTTAQICEIGWIVTDYTCQEVKSEYSTLIPMREIDLEVAGVERAFEVNGYPDRYAEYIMGDADDPLPTTSQVLCMWLDAAHDKRLGGANVAAYDLQVLARQCSLNGLQHPYRALGDFHCIDVCSTAAPLLVFDEVGTLGSATSLARWAGLGEEPKPHTALYGARQALLIYKKLLERYKNKPSQEWR